MEKDTIIAILVERGYKESNAKAATQPLQLLSSPLDAMFYKWIETEETEDFSAHDYSIATFINDWDMKYPAALLTMDWILKEPEAAIRELKKGIR